MVGAEAMHCAPKYLTAIYCTHHCVPARAQFNIHRSKLQDVPARPPHWPQQLLIELGLQPMQRGWRSHGICLSNKAVSAGVKAANLLMTAVLSADFALAIINSYVCLVDSYSLKMRKSNQTCMKSNQACMCTTCNTSQARYSLCLSDVHGGNSYGSRLRFDTDIKR